MKVAPLTTSSADSYTQHEQRNGLVVGIRPMTDKREIEDMFKVNLPDKGLLPILVVVENQDPTASFIMLKNKLWVQNEAMATNNSTQQRGKVTSGAGEGMSTAGGVMMGLGAFALPLFVVGAPLALAGNKVASDASVIEFNLADKEFYSWTLGPGEKARGFVYFQFPKSSPPSGNYHFVAEVKNPATGETIPFDFPVSLTLSK